MQLEALRSPAHAWLAARLQLIGFQAHPAASSYLPEIFVTNLSRGEEKLLPLNEFRLFTARQGTWQSPQPLPPRVSSVQQSTVHPLRLFSDHHLVFNRPRFSVVLATPSVSLMQYAESNGLRWEYCVASLGLKSVQTLVSTDITLTVANLQRAKELASRSQ